jgi:acyl carrier protein
MISKVEIFKRIKKAIHENFGELLDRYEIEEIDTTTITTPINKFDWDSLDLIEILTHIEEEFHMVDDIPIETAQKFQTFEDIVNYIYNQQLIYKYS